MIMIMNTVITDELNFTKTSMYRLLLRKPVQDAINAHILVSYMFTLSLTCSEQIECLMQFTF